MDILITPNYEYLNTFIDNTKKDFLAGEKFTEEESQSFFNKITYSYYNYLQRIDYIKNVLNNAKLIKIYDIMFIKTGSKLSEEDKLVLIRYFNVCKRNKFIIVLNNELIYTPAVYNQYDQSEIQEYINVTFARYINHRKYNIIKYRVSKYIKNLMDKL